MTELIESVQDPLKPPTVSINPFLMPTREAVQREVDKRRIRAMLHLTRSLMAEGNLRHPPIKHLWYPFPHDDQVYLREGNAPADRDRPLHLRGLKLHVDVSRLSNYARQAIRPGGLIDQHLEARLDGVDTGTRDEMAHRVLMHMIEKWANLLADKGEL